MYPFQTITLLRYGKPLTLNGGAGSVNDSRYTYRRIIVDEVQDKPSALTSFVASDFRWAVTGTPVSQSFNELTPVLEWLGHDSGWRGGGLRIDLTDSVDRYSSYNRSRYVRLTPHD